MLKVWESNRSKSLNFLHHQVNLNVSCRKYLVRHRKISPNHQTLVQTHTLNNVEMYKSYAVEIA